MSNINEITELIMENGGSVTIQSVKAIQRWHYEQVLMILGDSLRIGMEYAESTEKELTKLNKGE